MGDNYAVQSHYSNISLEWYLVFIQDFVYRNDFSHCIICGHCKTTSLFFLFFNPPPPPNETCTKQALINKKAIISL